MACPSNNHCTVTSHSRLLYLNFAISINWQDRKPVILAVVSVEVLPLDGHFAKHFVLLQVAIPIVHIHRQVTEPTWHLKLELLAKKWAGNKLIFSELNTLALQ
jgi:hypothetical protein